MIRVLVTGAFDSGKTSFIQSVSEINVVSAEKRNAHKDGISLALDFGRVTIDDENYIYFFGWPRWNFRPSDSFLHEIDLIVIMVNPAIKAIDKMQSSIITTKEIISTIQNRKIPYGLVVSKHKDRDCLAKDNMRVLLELPENFPMLECDPVSEPASVNRVLIEIFKMLPQDKLVQAAINKLNEDLI